MSDQASTSHPPRAARWGPWQLPASSEARPLKLLLLHGFCSSPRELRPLGQALSQRGYHCLAPLLPGHGESPAGMRACILEDWLEAVTLSYEALRRDGSPVAIVGFCLGAVLGLATAPELNPRGLVCLAAPSEPLPGSLFPERDKEDFVGCEPFLECCRSDTARAWRVAGAHGEIPSAFLERFNEAISRGREATGAIRCPVLAAIGEEETLLGGQPPSLPDSHPLTRTVEVPGAGYALPIDRGRRHLFKVVAEFLQELESLEQQQF